MIKGTNILILVLAVACFASAAMGGSINLRSSARVEAERPIFIGDIADLEGADALALSKVVVFENATRAAKSKMWVEITMRDIRRALEASDTFTSRLSISGGTCTVRLLVATTRPSSEAESVIAAPARTGAEAIEPSTVRASIAASIGRLLGVERHNLRLLFDADDEAFLRETTWGRRVTIQPTTGARSSIVMVEVRVFSAGDASMLERKRLRVEAEVRRRVVVMQRSLKRREVVEAGDVQMRELWMEVDGLRPVDSLDQALGSIAKRRINAGRVLRTSDLEPPIMVRRGQMVTVHCLRSGFAVKSRARAMAQGRLGEEVEFKLDGSARSFFARVDGPGEAVIDMDHTDRTLARESEE